MIKHGQPTERQLSVSINNPRGESPSCGYSSLKKIIKELKKVAKELSPKGKLRVAKSGFLDVCAIGLNLMIWPEGIWYLNVTKEDAPEIVKTYLKPEGADEKTTGASENVAGR